MTFSRRTMKKISAWKETADVREIQQRRYLSLFGQWHYEWLREIGREWKKRGEFAIDRFSLMDKYENKDDILVAGFVSLLTNDNARLAEQITELSNLIGREPYKMLTKRDFIVLSRPESANELIVGTNHRKCDLFNVLDWLWGALSARPMNERLQNVVKIQDERYMLAMLDVRLKKTDGIGKGVWKIHDEELGCPVNKDMLKGLQPEIFFKWFGAML